VIACNNDGVWNEQGAATEFSILPAFYQTNWFLLLCFLAAGLLVWMVYQWRLRLAAARLDQKFQERLAERTRIAGDLHDTLLQGFLGASMRLHVAHKHLPSDWPAKPLVAEVLEQMRNVIDEGRNAVQGLRSSSGSSRCLEQAFSEIGHELAERRQVEYRLLVQGTPIPLRPGIRDEVYLIGREALANAFHHSQASAIEVELQYRSSHLRILFRDNGCGIDPHVLRAGRHGHWGLCGMRERAERIGGKLRLSSGTAAGTEIEFLVSGKAAFERGSPGQSPGWLSRLYLRKNHASHPQAESERSE
jgi:signal transduction histidine kinase